MKLLLEVLKEYIAASKARKEEAKAKKELLKDKLRAEYFELLCEKYMQDTSILQFDVFFGDNSRIHVTKSRKDANQRPNAFWEEYNKKAAEAGLFLG